MYSYITACFKSQGHSSIFSDMINISYAVKAITKVNLQVL